MPHLLLFQLVGLVVLAADSTDGLAIKFSPAAATVPSGPRLTDARATKDIVAKTAELKSVKALLNIKLPFSS